ncbi:unnamed protein product [Hermetia illucens]|uniref:Cysteine/serine-rich nuclear protein N-terminal domain-containing protein n=2 Tax=Hermetia illucens TaxID=343691 RepID=A0A7R8URA2_HERIL|nr:unnamed protein product [Hermetia illucens]
MLRPIKSILTYLQLNTNSSSLFNSTSTNMSGENNDTTEAPLLTSETNNPLDEQNEGDGADQSSVSTSRKAPHDQNENEVIVEEHESQSSSNDGSDDVLLVEDEASKAVIDLTEKPADGEKDDASNEENACIFEVTTASGNSIESHEKIAKSGITNKQNADGGTYLEHGSEESGKDPTVGSLENVSIISEDESPQEEAEVFVISNDSQRVTDETESILCDTDDQDGSKNELLDLSLESNEVVILEETDHNDSITDPLHDPLAIDDYNADISNNITASCTGAGHSDTSGEGELLFTIATGSGILSESAPKSGNRLSQRTRRDNYGGTSMHMDASAEEQEVRSDGSDSGLGSETSTLQSANTSAVVDSPVCKPPPAKSNLKRRLDSLSEVSSNKRPKRSINFNGVKVYYFPRVQGFGCIPSQGGCTLGMAAHHVQSRAFTLAEHTAEQRRMHKQQMQEVNPRSSSSDETDSDEEISEASGSDLDADASGFLQPVPARQRRAILKAAGIRKIDPTEKDECRAIRSSREFCGCSCRGYCDPDTCSCSQAGIKCQVDRPNFPCGCTRDGCANVVGRVEFNPSRVRTHYIHTIMRLDLENKQKRAIDIETSATSSTILSYGSNSVTSTINCSTVSSLGNLCSYNNLVNSNHMRSQQQMYSVGVSESGQVLQHNQNSYVTGGNSIYTNRVSNSALPSTSNLMNVDGPSLIRPRLQENGDEPSNSNLAINDSLAMSLQNSTNHSHDIDLHYAFRDDTSTTADLSSQANPNNILALGDYAPGNSLYHEVYNGHSFLNQNYSNPTFCQSQNINYQQSFINYTPTVNSSVQIGDLTSEPPVNPSDGGTNCSDPSYINLNSPVGSQSRVDAINDLLHSSRNLGATSTTTASTVDSTATVSYMMAPSAQTSTSITEGTQTTITQPQVTKPTTTVKPVNSKAEEVVDLTDRVSPPHEEKGEDDESSSSDVIEVVDADKAKINVSSVDDSVKLTEPNNPPLPVESVLISETDDDVTVVSPAVSVVTTSSTSVDENHLVETAIA